MDVKC